MFKISLNKKPRHRSRRNSIRLRDKERMITFLIRAAIIRLMLQKTLYHRELGVLNFHLTLQYEVELKGKFQYEL